ncbi:hypothetical protein DSM100685_0382 [Bifidobacterium avesanii]|nr:hypothetical protein DSM100685_0382 [Bifidobacterium avesanii]
MREEQGINTVAEQRSLLSVMRRRCNDFTAQGCNVQVKWKGMPLRHGGRTPPTQYAAVAVRPHLPNAAHRRHNERNPGMRCTGVMEAECGKYHCNTMVVPCGLRPSAAQCQRESNSAVPPKPPNTAGRTIRIVCGRFRMLKTPICIVCSTCPPAPPEKSSSQGRIPPFCIMREASLLRRVLRTMQMGVRAPKDPLHTAQILHNGLRNSHGKAPTSRHSPFLGQIPCIANIYSPFRGHRHDAVRPIRGEQ